MKKYIFIILFISIFSPLTGSIDFSIEKVNTFAFCQNYFSNTTIEVDPPYMYALTSYGLEIYEIQYNGQLQKISELPIMKSCKFVKRDNYLYIGSGLISYFDQSPLFIYQVDVSDEENPYINNTIEFDNSYHYIIPELIGDYLVTINGYNPDNIYTLPNLELYATIQNPDISLTQIKENICISPVGWSVFDIYDTSDLSNIQYLNTIDMSPYHQGYNPTSFKVINDTTLIASGQSAISFWNISNVAQWEYISHYEPDVHLHYGINFAIQENYIILSQFYGLELIDISDLYNPQSLDFCDFNSSSEYYIVNNNDYIYIGTGNFGMGIYQIENEEIVFIENYYEYPSFNYSTHIYQNHLFIESPGHGIYVFDISNPMDPLEIITDLKDAPLRSPVGHDSLIVVHDYDEISIKIYDISEPDNPILRNTIDGFTLLDWWYSVIRFDDSEPQSMYFSNFNNGNIRKYDISEPGDCPLLFTYNITNTDTDFIAKDGYGYIFTPRTYPQHLYVIGGLYNNEPEIVNTIYSFTQIQEYIPYFRLCGDYLCMFPALSIENTKLYSLEDPLNPELEYIPDIPSSNSWPEIYDDLLFTKTGNLSFVYDLNECTGDTLYYIDYFDGLFMMYGFDFYDIGDVHYLFVTEQSSVGVYEFSYSCGVDDEPELVNNPIICSPNPFSTSTTISFNITTENTENTEIKIYNVKGQLVRELLPVAPSPDRPISVTWDGRDESGKEVKSGVYFCIFQSGEEQLLKKLVLVR